MTTEAQRGKAAFLGTHSELVAEPEGHLSCHSILSYYHKDIRYKLGRWGSCQRHTLSACGKVSNTTWNGQECGPCGAVLPSAYCFYQWLEETVGERRDHYKEPTICGVLSSYHDIKTEFSMVSPTHDRGEIPESDLIYRICQGDVQEPVS